MDQTQGLFGRLAVHMGWITQAQLIEAITEQGRFGNEQKRLGHILVERRLLSIEQVNALLHMQEQILQQQAQKRQAVAKAKANPNAQWSPGQDPFAAATTPADAGGYGAAKRAPTHQAATESAPTHQAATESTPTRQAATAPTHQAATAPTHQAATATAPTHQAATAPTHQAATAPTHQAATESTPTHQAAARSSGGAQHFSLNAILSAAAQKSASDVHLHPGSPIFMRLVGALVAEGEPLDAGDLDTLLGGALSEDRLRELDDSGQVDLAIAIPGIGRFRSNIYRDRRGTNGVFRFIADFVPTLEQLGLPSALSRMTTFHQGLVLVTGPAGCGKSTTMAALVNLINEDRQDHILTIEDPIEYVHPSKGCLVNQREVRSHTESFARALRGALREDPDVIVIGELRDLETISLALTAAETGHLVIATLHTGNAARTINRIVGAFAPDEQAQVRTMISESLRAVISQRLLPRKSGDGRVVALEILRMNRAISNVIRENRTFQLRSMLQTGRNQGMLLLDVHLAELVKNGDISREEALRHATETKLIP